MPRKIEKWLIVNVLTGDMRLLTKATRIGYLEVAYPIIVTLPEAYPNRGRSIEITLPALSAPVVEMLDDLLVKGSEDAPQS